MNQESGQ